VHVVVGFAASRGLARWIASGFVARAVTFVGGDVGFAAAACSSFAAG
jgi:hypothetical protein